MAIAIGALAGAALHAQSVSVDPDTIGKEPVTNWPTFNGDYSGKRYSTLTQIGPTNLDRLEPLWVYRIAEVGAQRGAPVPIIKCTPLLVNGVLYMTIPDHLWALDARTGKELWHYDWVDHGGHLIGQRGVGIWKTTVFFLTPDNWLIALDANSGKELWKKNYADARKQYFSTSAPLIVKNHVIVGVGGDAMDMPGFLDSFDPVTGDLQWTWWSTPRAGDPALKTWPNETASDHGGGMTWMPGTYDPDAQPALLADWEHESGVCRAGTAGRESVDRIDCRARRGYGKAQVVFPGVATRHARFRQYDRSDSVREHDTRKACKTAGPGSAQWILCDARPRDGQVPGGKALRSARLFVRSVGGRRADSDSRQGSFLGRFYQYRECLELARPSI